MAIPVENDNSHSASIKDLLISLMLEAYNSHQKAALGLTISSFPGNVAAPFYGNLSDIISRKISKTVSGSLLADVLAKSRTRTNYSGYTIEVISDFIEKYIPGSREKIYSTFENKIVKTKVHELKVIEEKDLEQKVNDFLATKPSSKELEDFIKELPEKINRDENILMEIGAHFEYPIFNLELADKYFKKVIAIKPEVRKTEYIARYFWYRRSNYTLAKNIYRGIQNLEDVNTIASIQVFNYHLEGIGDKDILYDFKDVNFDLNDVSNEWVSLKCFFIKAFKEPQSIFNYEALLRRQFTNDYYLLEFYLYIYALTGMETIDNTLLGNIVLKDKIEELRRNNVTLDYFNRMPLVDYLLRNFHFDLFYISSYLNSREISETHFLANQIHRDYIRLLTTVELFKKELLKITDVNSKKNRKSHLKSCYVNVLEIQDRYMFWMQYLSGKINKNLSTKNPLKFGTYIENNEIKDAHYKFDRAIKKHFKIRDKFLYYLIRALIGLIFIGLILLLLESQGFIRL